MRCFPKCLLCLALCLCLAPLRAQDAETLRFTLGDVIALAQSEAPDVLIAKTRLRNSYWQYQSFQADFRPQIDLRGTLPSFDRTISVITLPDGTDAFIQRSLASGSLDVSLSQDISLTGGNIFVGTSLRRIDIFTDAGNTVSYLSTPLELGFRQPLFNFNRMKWDKRIQPMYYQEAGRRYSEDLARLAQDAAIMFFEVYIAQMDLAAAARDRANADTLYNIAKGRFEVGRIAENELLQIELSAQNTDAAFAQAELNLQTSTERLRNFLGIQVAVNFDLIPPDALLDYTVDAGLALSQAVANRSQGISFGRRLEEARRDMAEAKGNAGLNAELFGSFGLSQTATNLGDAYADPLDQERVTLGFSMPLADWGKTKARIKIAESNLELVEMTVAQERVNFEREILLKVKQFDLVRRQCQLSARAYEVSQRNEQITRNRYYIGKLGITELILAVENKESARRAYMASLRNFWVAHYELQALTLYDFERGEALVRNTQSALD